MTQTIDTQPHERPDLDYVERTLVMEGLDPREAVFRDSADTLSGKMTFEQKAAQIRHEARLQQEMAKGGKSS